MKLCIITCYNQPDYVRAKTLRASTSMIEDVQVLTIKNSHTGLLRYGEVFAKVLRTRFRDNPDAYLLTFRGYEMLLPIRLISLGKPFIYDEFINPIEWVVKEQRQVEAKQTSGALYKKLVTVFSKFVVAVVASPVFRYIYRQLIRSVDGVLTDTASHADISAELTKAPRSKFYNIPVGVDETSFSVQPRQKKKDTFTVFYYGNMLPLHGLDYVIKAAVALADKPVRFRLVGGNATVARNVKRAIKQGADIEYSPWVEFERLPELMSAADVCLAGPFGDTFQARYVITGKAYQYLAMGRPTIVGKNLESDVFTDKRTALVVPQADASAIADAIEWGRNNPKDLQRIGTSGRQLFDKKFALQHIASRLEKGLSLFGAYQPRTGANSNKHGEHSE